MLAKHLTLVVSLKLRASFTVQSKNNRTQCTLSIFFVSYLESYIYLKNIQKAHVARIFLSNAVLNTKTNKSLMLVCDDNIFRGLARNEKKCLRFKLRYRKYSEAHYALARTVESFDDHSNYLFLQTIVVTTKQTNPDNKCLHKQMLTMRT